MPHFFEIRLAFAHLRAGGHWGENNPFVSFIAFFSVLGIALGVMALVVVPAVMNGFQKEVREAMLAVVPHLEVRQAQGMPLSNAQALKQDLLRQPYVAAAQTFVEAPAVVLAGENMRGVRVLGLDWTQEARITQLGSRLDAQAKAALANTNTESNGVVLGVELAQALAVGVGDTLQLFSADSQNIASQGGSISRWPPAQAVQVAGVVRTGYYADDATLLLMPYARALSYLHLSDANGVRVRLHNAELATDIARVLSRQQTPQALFFLDWTQRNRAWFDAIPLQKRLIAVILAAIVAVAAFNLVSTLVMVVSDRRGEVAILRTLGASPGSIVRIFMLQGGILGLLGTGLGLLSGLLLVFNITPLVAALEAFFAVRFLDQSVYFLDYIPSDPRFADIVWVVLLALVLAFIATLYPSWRAARLQPAQVLSHE